MSPENQATLANPNVVKLVPNRTDYKLWKESTLNLLAIQGLLHYTKTPGFGANLDMQTASKEKVHCANNMSKCYQIIWNTLDRSIQAQANFQQLNHEDQEKVPLNLLKLCESFKNSKSESSLLWAKISQPPNDTKQLVNWVDDYQYNFARYQDMNVQSLEVDHILYLWSRSSQERIREMARVIQDEKSKDPHNVDRIILMIKNQADRLGQWHYHESADQDQDHKSSRKRKKDDNLNKDSKNNGSKKQKTNQVYCQHCFEKFKVKRYGHTKDECNNNPSNAGQAQKPKVTKKITADTGSAATLMPINEVQRKISRADLKGLSKEEVLTLLSELQLDDFLSTDEDQNKMDEAYLSSLSFPHSSSNANALLSFQTPLSCLMTKNTSKTQTFIGFDGSIQTGLRGTEPINLAEGLSINDTYELKSITDPIVSVSQVNDQGHFTIFTKNELFVIPEDIVSNKLLELLKTKSILGGYREDGVYYFNEQKSIQSNESNVSLFKCYNVIARDINKDNLAIWHQRLGHIGWNRLIQTLRVHKMLPNNLKYDDICDICFKSKMVDRAHGMNIKSTMPNEIISMDLIDFGKQYVSIRNYRYVLVIVDHYTSYTWTYLLENRKDLMKPIDEWYQFIKTQIKDCPVKTLLADGEFITNKLVSFCSKHGIKHDTSEPYVSKHNGMCERTNRSIEEMVRCILFDSSFSIEYWCYAVEYAVYIINRLGKARLKWQSPFSQYFGSEMFHRLTHIRKFGSVGWMRRNPKKNSSRDKLSSRAIRV
jgi:hypothetical protein